MTKNKSGSIKEFENKSTNPCSEVRRTCNQVYSQQKSCTVNFKQIDVFIDSIEKEIKTKVDGKLVFDKWSEFHLSDISNYSLE